jgi:hypothetical protein
MVLCEDCSEWAEHALVEKAQKSQLLRGDVEDGLYAVA